MKQIALRCLANLACDPIMKPLFIQLGVHKILRACIDDHQIYFDDDEVCFNKVEFQIQTRVYKSPNDFNFETLLSCYVAFKRFAPWPTWISIPGKAHLKMECSEFIQKVERPRSSKMMLFLYMAWVVALHQHGQRKRRSLKMENLFPKESTGLINGSPEI